MPSTLLTQVQVAAGRCEYGTISQSIIDAANTGSYSTDEVELQRMLLESCPESLWPRGSHLASCPRPILVGQKHQELLRDMSESLTIAITDIIGRWWTDHEASLPQRMPLEREEEDILKWIDSQVACGNKAEYRHCLGSWRPDFLVEIDENGEESYRITEINARFVFNGLMHLAYGQESLHRTLGQNSAFVAVIDPEKVLQCAFALVEPGYPLHLLKGAEAGIDIHMFIRAAEQRLGIKPRLITPADLRLLSDPSQPSGYRLCCIVESTAAAGACRTVRDECSGEVWEEIRQVGVELHQHELLGLGREMLQQVGLRCFNDLRTVLLVHDKRMLGVVRQETPGLLRRGVLTPAQAKVLLGGIAETILPASAELSELLRACGEEQPRLKDEYILKPIRGGKGEGIVFGDETSHEAWLTALQSIASPGLSLRSAYIVQRHIVTAAYDMILRESAGRVFCPLVGTFHIVNGELLGHGIWRAAIGRIVAISSGGSWMCSVMLRP